MNTVLSARIRRLLAGSALLLPLLHAHPAYPGDRFICAGVPPLDTLSEGAAKVAAGRVKEGSLTAIVIFAKFKGEDSELVSPPSWAQDMFDPERPGSITHFYQTMSFGKLNIDGAVAPKYYESEHEASWYLSDDPTRVGKFGVFTLDILEQADEDLDFSQYNNDGPDGIPNSPDDDALVDALFMVVRDIPPNFLLGPATGISHLGFQDSYETNDLRRLGRRTRIHTRLGVLNQANTYAEATGTICHEYGHILGLPDLFNLAYVKQGGGPPATDSAGIGAWGVMGWGALGWHPGYGPSSLSAWSRLELGWGTVTKAIQLNEIMELEDVALNGQMYEIRFPFRERFLIENRQRENNYYDRGIPGEGLLIWHIDPSGSVTAVDLECADGRWRDAGFPLGSQPDLTEGEDNLDFWAHDAAYSESRRGNFGDSTDPYDGVRYTSFSETTNPGSHSNNGKWSVRLDDITIDAAGKATAKVTAVPPVVVKGFNLGDTNRDSVIVAGELVALGWTVEGHRRVLNNFIRVTISTEDPLVEIVRPSFTRRYFGRMSRTYGDTVVWAEVPASATRWALPQLRFTNSADVFAGTHSATVWMNIDHKIGLDWSPLWRAPFELVAISPRQEIASVRVLDEDNGNGDGRIQQGEIVRLELEVADVDPRLLSGLMITLRNLDSGAILTESPEVFFETAGGRRNRSSRSPEFLVRTDLAVGAALDFQVTFDSGFGVHRDTIRTFVAAGGDLTPPRIEGETGMLIRRQVAEGVSLLLPESAILEPSPLSETAAVVYSTRDTTEVGRVRLDRQADGYRGVWADPPAGTYLIRILVADAAGNATLTPLQLFEVEARSVVAETPISEDLMAELYVRSEVNAVVHSPDGQVTAVAEGVSIRLYENTGLGEVGVLYGHTGQVRSLSFSPDGSLLASGSWDATVLWDANTLEQVLVLPRHDDRVEVVTFSPDGSLLASSGWHGSIRLWKLAPDASLGSVVNAVEFDSLLRRRNVGVLCLAFHPDGLSLVAGSSDGAVSLWSLGPKREVIRELHQWKLAPDASLGSVVNAVAFSNDGNWLATGGRDGTMRIHDMLHDQRENNYTPPAVVIDELQGWISDLAFSPDGFSMASASRDGSVRLWGVPEFRPKGVFEGGVEQVLSLSFRPDGHQLAAGSRDGRVQFWRIAPKVVEVAEGEQSVTPNSPFLAYPNPFNGGISIPFRVDTDGDVRVVIHGMAGQVVRVLEMGQLPAGDYASPSRAAFWDGVTDEGANAASGVYLLTVEAAGARTRRKIALVR